MKMSLYFLLLHVLPLIQHVDGLNLIAIPKQIESGTTENLLVNCSLNVERTPELAVLNSIILSRSDDMNKSDYQVVASINTLSWRVHVYDGDGTGRGVVSNKGESYLSVQWAYPINDMAGSYMCEANGMSLSLKPKTISAFEEISSGQLSQSTMIHLLRSNKLEYIKRMEEMKSVFENIKILTSNLTLSTDYIYNLKKNDQVSMKTLFYESPLYNGHRYFLVKESAVVLPSIAQVMCYKYGGYLAEIDDDDELNFVRMFLRKYPIYLGVLIAGSDEGHEGIWTNRRTNTVLKYSKFFHSEPNGGKAENCMVLWRDFDWLMGDYHCIVFSTNKLYGYLCEDFKI